MATKKSQDKSSRPSEGETNQLEQALKDVKLATGMFARTFEGGEGQAQLAQSNTPSEGRDPQKNTKKVDSTPEPSESSSSTREPSKVNDEPPNISKEHEEALDKILQLFQSPDETTKFIGLALLRGVIKMIDNKEKQASYAAIAPKCWNAIPTTFLDRLFNQYAKMIEGNADARAMFELAIGITHAFVCLLSVPQNRRVLLPVNMSKELVASWLKRIEFMVLILDRPSQAEFREPVIEVMQLFSRIPDGASVLLGVKDWAPLLRLSANDKRPLEVFTLTYCTLAKIKNDQELVPLATLRKSFNRNINQVIPIFTAIDRPEMLWDSLNEVTIALGQLETTPSLPETSKSDRVAAMKQKNLPSWFLTIAGQIRRSSYIKRNQQKVRTEAIILAITLSETYHAMLFAQSLFTPYSEPESRAATKPETYDFIVMLISETTRSLTKYDKLSKQSYEYLEQTMLLKACYDLQSCFVGYLVGREHAETPQSPVKPLLPPDLLLQLRKLTSELMQMTILTIRERFGPPGTVMELRDPIEEAKRSYPWKLVHEVTCAQLRALALWLRDDDGEQLRREAASIMDVFLQLVEKGRSLQVVDQVMMCLEGICETSAGTKSFLTLGGWQFVAAELDYIVKQSKAIDIMDDYRGEQIVTVLETVIHQTGEAPPRVTTAKLLHIVAAVEQDSTRRSRLQLALLSLASYVLDKTPLAQRKQYAKVAEKILFKASALYHLGGSTKDDFCDITMRLTDIVPIPGISL